MEPESDHGRQEMTKATTSTEKSKAKRAAPLRVLLATDGSDHSVRAATFLARLLPSGSAEVRLVTVISHETDPYSAYGERLSDADDRIAEIGREERRAFDKPRDLLEGSGQEVSSQRRVGNPPPTRF
jgi:nucleotide-binding universal stress UspA family protein